MRTLQVLDFVFLHHRNSKQLEVSSFRVTSSIVAAIQTPTGQSASAQGDSITTQSLSSAATAAVKSSASGPVWNQWLCCDFTEQQRSTALLQLTLENEAGNVPIARYCLILLMPALPISQSLTLGSEAGSTTGCLCTDLFWPQRCYVVGITLLDEGSSHDKKLLEALFKL